MKFDIVGDEQGAALLADAGARVRAMVPYLRAEVGERRTYVERPFADTEGGWIRCHDLVGDPTSLASVIRATGRQLGTDDPVVAASLFVQNYSYRVLTLAIACATVAGVVPDSAASVMALSLVGGRASSLAYTTPSVLVVTETSAAASAALADPARAAAALDFLMSRGVDEHLALLVHATREGIRVGARLLWGNVAASAAVAFRTMEGCRGPWVRDLGAQFFDACPPELRGLGSFFALAHAGRQGWYWERTNCCLYDRLPGTIRCGDCSRTPVDERRAAYRASLESS